MVWVVLYLVYFTDSCWAFSAVVGGLMENAFDFINKHGGLTTERIYPYRARDGNCDSAKVEEKLYC